MSSQPRPGTPPPRTDAPPPRPDTAPPKPDSGKQQKPSASQRAGQTPPSQTGGAKPTVTDLSTRLDGQRGWINELNESLKKRSIIALVLTCLAVGVGAAAIYISVSKNADADRITALEARIAALEAATGTSATGESVTPEVGVPPESGTTTDSGAVIPATPSE
ncbi:MAG: hypothetical protein ACERKT_03255 [Acidobacteriota bacterium]